MVIPNFRENSSLCLASAIEFYILKTKHIRPANTDLLSLSLKKHIQPVSTQRLSKWIKLTLEASGIDTSIFSSYNTRHAAIWAAHRAGISIETVRNRAGWTNKSEIFARSYNRPLPDDVTGFAKGILNTFHDL